MMKNNGFTLVEVMIAITILSIGMLAVNTMQVQSIGGNSRARSVTTASIFAAEQIENLMALPYDHASLQDTNPIAPPETLEQNLSHPFTVLPSTSTPDFVARPPDGQVTSPDGDYTVCWNIAVNSPVPNTKTIRVIVISNGRGTQKIVPIDIIKTNAI
jgi:type IV pilus assembly protein PilV